MSRGVAGEPDRHIGRDPTHGTILGFDFGLKRTGVSVGDIAVGVAHPLETIVTADESQRMRRVERLIQEWEPVLLIVGLPQRQDGKPHELEGTIREWVQAVHSRCEVPVRFVDESLSSHAASLALAESGIRGIRQKPYLDSVAAQQILQSFLDGQSAIA